MSDDLRERRRARAAIGIFAVIAALIGVDLAVDYGEGAGAVHLTIELVVLFAAAGGIALLWQRFEVAQTGLAQARSMAERWRRENQALLDGLGAALSRQFADWHLSKAESEVALLLLKGLSLKEIARMRDTSERTVREQARAVYRKSGLTGRSSLAAFFLEDLLLPPGGGSAEPPAPGSD